MNAVIGKEPVVAQLLAGVVAFLAAKFFPELNLSDTQALAIAGGIIVVLTPFTRQLVTPTAKLPPADVQAPPPVTGKG